jgi:hypothetical protein
MVRRQLSPALVQVRAVDPVRDPRGVRGQAGERVGDDVEVGCHAGFDVEYRRWFPVRRGYLHLRIPVASMSAPPAHL